MKYNLNFHEAIDLIIKGEWVKGERFADGVFLKLNKYGVMVVVDVNQLYKETNLVSLKSLSSQKFRIIKFATHKNLAR